MTQSNPIISNETPLVFMHLPKTGGMSMFAAFAAIWRTAIADLYNVSARNAQEAFKLLRDPNKAIYCGHYGVGIHEWLDRPAYYASVMRDPVERMVSLYFYCLPLLEKCREIVNKNGGDFQKVRNALTLPDFFFDFSQCLQGFPTVDDFFSSPSAELDNGMVRRFSGYGLKAGPCPESALEQAKDNIENYFSVVGLLDRYPETLDLMSQTFSLPQLTQGHVNKRPKRKEKETLDNHILAKIRAMNRLDQDLYDWVSSRFDKSRAAPRAIAVSPKSRTDLAGMPLWLGVGQSPIREAAMQVGAIPKRRFDAILCSQLAEMRIRSGVIFAELETVILSEEKTLKPSGTIRLGLEPKTARALMEALKKALEISSTGA